MSISKIVNRKLSIVNSLGLGMEVPERATAWEEKPLKSKSNQLDASQFLGVANQNSVQLCAGLSGTLWFTPERSTTAKPFVNFVPNILHLVFRSGWRQGGEKAPQSSENRPTSPKTPEVSR